MIPVLTLSERDAEILARSIESGTASNGRVERHGLQWRSDALRTWELIERRQGRKPAVNIRIDELNLSLVYVETLEDTRQVFRAVSTQPLYTRNLSLYEHRLLKAELRKLNTKDRLVRMSDVEAFKLRIEYYASLGRANDPVAYRRLVNLRDQLAEHQHALVRRQSKEDTKTPPLESASKKNPTVKKPQNKPKATRSQRRPPRKTVQTPSPVEAPATDESPAASPKSRRAANFPSRGPRGEKTKHRR